MAKQRLIATENTLRNNQNKTGANNLTVQIINSPAYPV